MKKSSLILGAGLITVMMVTSCGGGGSKKETAATSNKDTVATSNEKAAATSNEVTIGKQVWMAQNLNVDTFRNGDPIPEVKTKEEWEKAGNNKQPAWCYYDNDPANGKKYGKLYNWYAVNDSSGLAPKGWHVPSDEEWTILTDFLGGEKVAGTKMKSKSGWQENGNGTNESGFSGLPGGSCGINGDFSNVGGGGGWWSSSEYNTEENNTTDAWVRLMDYSRGSAYRIYGNKKEGFSVRCLRD